jgi:hypothetical protein
VRKQGRFQFSTHEALARQVFSKYRSEARKRGRDFSLSQAYLIELIGQACHYCRNPPGNAMRRAVYAGAVLFYSGIDRKDNDVGYVEGNVVPCCARCNYVKGEALSYGEMVQVGKLLRRMKKGSP